MATLWRLVGDFLAALIIVGLLGLSITEFIGARVPGFMTISEATKVDVLQGDYRLFVAVLALFLLGGLWWSLHILLHL